MEIVSTFKGVLELKMVLELKISKKLRTQNVSTGNKTRSWLDQTWERAT
jgi:hypothetical protein